MLAIALPTHMSYSQHMKQPRKTQYYKVQYYDETSLTWIDVQKQYDTTDDAFTDMSDDDLSRKFRFMMVDGKKRMPVYVHTDAIAELLDVRHGTSPHQPRQSGRTVKSAPTMHHAVTDRGAAHIVIGNR